MSEFLRIDRQGPLATIWIDRQPKMNTLTVAMRDELPAMFRQLDADDSVRVVIIRGAGGKAFSAGGDVAEFLTLLPADLEAWGDTLSWAERCRKPVIAAIDGFAMGAGLELALACDFRIATRRSEFAFPEIRLGMIPGSGGTQRALRLIGMTRGKLFMMTGRRIGAERAEAWGLVTECVPDDGLDAAVGALAGELAERAPLALRTLKTVLDRGANAPLETALELERKSYAWLRSTQDKWVEGSEEIALVNGHAVAARTQHRAIFLPNLNAPAPPIDVSLPDGKRLRSQVVGLAYTEADTGKSVFISELKDSVGQLVGPNQLIYRDAFESINADVQYTINRAFFEQDIILREKLPSPDQMGLNTETCKLEVWTEFFTPPEPGKSARSILRNSGKPDLDESLDFGTMQMIGGKTFSLEEEGATGGLEPVRGNSLLNAKEWQVINGMTFLIESVPYQDVLPLLESLPAPSIAWKSDAKAKQRLAGNAEPGKRRKPISVAQSSPSLPPTGKEVRIAAAKAPDREPGLVLDYVLVNSTQTNFTFKGDSTYLINGWITFGGTTVIEGGDPYLYGFDKKAARQCGCVPPAARCSAGLVARDRLCAVLTSAICENACGKLPSSSPW